MTKPDRNFVNNYRRDDWRWRHHHERFVRFVTQRKLLCQAESKQDDFAIDEHGHSVIEYCLIIIMVMAALLLTAQAVGLSLGQIIGKVLEHVASILGGDHGPF